MKRTVQEIRAEFVAGGQGAVASAARIAATSILGVAQASQASASASDQAAAASARQVTATTLATAAARENVRVVQETTAASVRAVRDAAEQREKAARDELARRKTAVSDAQRAKAELTAGAGDDLKNDEVTTKTYITELERRKSAARKLMAGAQGRLKGLDPDDAEGRNEARLDIERGRRRVAQALDLQSQAQADFQNRHQEHFADVATANARIQAAKRARDEQKAVVEATSEAGRSEVAVAEDVAAKTVKAAREAGRQQVSEARKTDTSVRESARASGRSQVEEIKSVERQARTSASSIRIAMRQAYGSGAASYLPRSGLGGVVSGAVGGAGRFLGRGALPVAGSAIRGAVGTAFGAGSLLVGGLGQALSLTTSLAGGILRVGGSVVRLGVDISAWIGRTAFSAVTGLLGLFRSLLTTVSSLGIKVATVGAGLLAAGFWAARKAAAAAGEDALAIKKSAMAPRNVQSLGGTQAILGATDRLGIDRGAATGAMAKASDSVVQAATDEGSQAAEIFRQLGINVRTASGQIKGTETVLADLGGVMKKLGAAERIDLAEKVFGSDWREIEPLLDALMKGGTSLFDAAYARRAQLGAVFTQGDVRRAKIYKESLVDVKDAVTGVGLAIARAFGDSFSDLNIGFANLLAANRGSIAGWARYVAGRVAGVVLSVSRDVQLLRAGFGGSVSNRWLLNVAEALKLTAYVAHGTLGVVGKIYDTFAAPVRAPWVESLSRGFYGLGRLVRETILTLGGENLAAREFPWLVALRDGVYKAGRLVREAFSTAVGETEKVTEFPWLVSIREGVASAVTTVREFGTEVRAAVMGDKVQDARFPWLQSIREQVLATVQVVKVAWTDLVGVWNGDEAETGVGKLAERIRTGMQDVQSAFYDAVGNVRAAWNDLETIFSGRAALKADFEFPGLKAAVTKVYALVDGVKAVWAGIKPIYEFVDGTVQRLSGGWLDIRKLGLLSLLGVTRVLVGTVRAVVGGLVAFRGAAAAAGAASLAGGMRTLGTATVAAGAAADGATARFGRLGTAIVGALGKLQGVGGIAALIGGGLLADSATPNSAWGALASTAGGALQGAAGGAMAGGALGSFVPLIGNAVGTAVGAVLGGAWGGVGGYRQYRKTSDEELKAKFLEAHPDKTEADFDHMMGAQGREQAANMEALKKRMGLDDETLAARQVDQDEGMDALRESLGMEPLGKAADDLSTTTGELSTSTANMAGAATSLADVVRQAAQRASDGFSGGRGATQGTEARDTAFSDRELRRQAGAGAYFASNYGSFIRDAWGASDKIASSARDAAPAEAALNPVVINLPAGGEIRARQTLSERSSMLRDLDRQAAAPAWSAQ